MTIADMVTRARNRGVPLIGVCTPDPASTMRSIVKVLNGAPIFQWDIVTGCREVSKSAAGLLEQIMGDQYTMTSINPTETLGKAAQFPPKSVLFFSNAQRFTTNEGVAQAIWNLRDQFKANGRTLIMTGPSMDLPPEIAQDVIVFDEAYPDEAESAAIIRDTVGTVAPLSDADMERAVCAVRGLAAFPIEQVTALSMSKTGVSIPDMWERKRKTIEQTRGLAFDRGNPTFDSIRGLAQAKKFGTGIFKGGAPPRIVVRVDEIEKMLGGAGTGGGAGDSSGVSQDALGVILREMEDNEWGGMIAYGVPGSGKTLYSRALAETHGVPAMSMDLGAMQGSLVGESQKAIRQAMKVVSSMAGKGGAMFVATCNKLNTLPPELRRRFKYGIWFFDLPGAEEQADIWALYRDKFKVPGDAPLPDYTGWTGAEIRNCCELAWRMGVTPLEAGEMIVPIAKSDADTIKSARKLADGKFLSASYPGAYRLSRGVEDAAPRAIEIGGSNETA